MARKRTYVVADSYWGNEDYPIATTWGPYTLEEAKKMFLYRLMVNLEISPNKDSGGQAKIYCKYAYTNRYYDREGHWMICIQKLQR